jgi:phenylacetate-CoA ligase
MVCRRTEALNSWLSRNFILWPATLAKGERIRPFLRQYRASQWFDAGRLASDQDNALCAMLLHAQRGSRFHQQRWTVPATLQPAQAREFLAQLPLMTKADLAERLDEIIVAGRTRFAQRKTTGGSTGQAVTLLKNPQALARERAVTYRAYEWAGVEPGAPQARFWGVPHTRSRRWYYTIVDIVANRHRFSAFNFDQHSLESYYEGLVKFRPTYLYGYVSMLQQFAQFVHETGRRLPPSVVSIITTSEVLTEGIRQELTARLGVPVFNEYGCGEVGSIAHECERGTLHLMAENMIVEILDADGRPAQEGELVVTDLYNFATPMIRYRLGDFGVWSKQQCACGRGLPQLERVYGRAYDFVRTPEGRMFHPEAVIYVFEMMKERGVPIRQFQVEQIASDRLVVRAVVRDGFDTATEQQIVGLLREHLHPKFEIEIERVKEIPREKSGKLRLVKSQVTNRAAS